jgi:phage recombination protein Bet
MVQNNTPAKQETSDKNTVVYQVAGQDVKLSYNIVRNFLTKGTGNVTDQDLVQFISICKYNQLNPFLNEAYLVKFGTAPAQMIVSKEALMKRAESCKEYEGIQAGIILQTKEGGIKEVEGCFRQSDEILVGGWAKVYRSDRKYPIVSRVNLDEYDKKQSIWNEKKSTMISKVAKVQALREAFPTQLGAMYTAEESNIKDIDFEEVKDRKSKDEVEDQREPEQTEKIQI